MACGALGIATERENESGHPAEVVEQHLDEGIGMEPPLKLVDNSEMNMPPEVPKIAVPIHWKTVDVTPSVMWHRKARLNVRERDAIAGPRVYRWVLRDKTRKISAVYIGETERFEVRLRSYCIGNVKKPTITKRIRQELKRCEDEGGSVELQFLDLELGYFILNGIPINRFSLPEHTARRLLESIAVFLAEAEAKAEGYQVLNHSLKNVVKKDIRKLLNQMVNRGKLLDSARRIVLQIADIDGGGA